MRALGQQHGYVVVQPTAPGTPPGWTQSTDAPLVFAFLQDVAIVLGTDPKRAHAMGFSQGGGMTFRMVCAHADFFASVSPIGAIAGCEFSGANTPSEEIDILQVHGHDDDVIVDFDAIAVPQRDLALGAWSFGAPSIIEQDAGHLATRWSTRAARCSSSGSTTIRPKHFSSAGTACPAATTSAARSTTRAWTPGPSSTASWSCNSSSITPRDLSPRRLQDALCGHRVALVRRAGDDRHMMLMRLARTCAGFAVVAGALACTPEDFVFVSTGGEASGGGAAGAAGGSGGAGGTGGVAPTFTLEDPLKGGTKGNAIGGALGPDGWTITSDTDRLWYELPRLTIGSFEFTVSNLTMDNMPEVDHELFAMYEAGFGMTEPINYDPEFRNNHFKVMLRVHGQGAPGMEGQQQLVWRMCPSGAPGHDECGCTEFFDEPEGGDTTWDGSPQRLRVDWTETGARYLRNGTVVHQIEWSTGKYAPQSHHVSLGTSRPVVIQEAGMPVGAIFSDVVITGNEGEAAVCR
jgi:hypothetical protein